MQRDLDALLARQDRKALDKIRSLATGEVSGAARHDFIASLSAAYASDRPAADPAVSFVQRPERTGLNKAQRSRRPDGVGRIVGCATG